MLRFPTPLRTWLPCLVVADIAVPGGLRSVLAAVPLLLLLEGLQLLCDVVHRLFVPFFLNFCSLLPSLVQLRIFDACKGANKQ